MCSDQHVKRSAAFTCLHGSYAQAFLQMFDDVTGGGGQLCVKFSKDDLWLKILGDF